METEVETQTQSSTPVVAEVHTVGTETDYVPTVVMATSGTQLDAEEYGDGEDDAGGDNESATAVTGVDSPFCLSHEYGIASPCEVPPNDHDADDMSHDSVKGEASVARTSAVTSEPDFVIDEEDSEVDDSTQRSSVSTFSVKSDSPTPVPSYEASQHEQRQQIEARRENLRRLGEQVEHFVCHKLSLTPYERMQREEFTDIMKSILREAAGKECNLHVHGSFATDLALKDSDIDFLASDYSPQQPLTVFESMERGLLNYGVPKGASMGDEQSSSGGPSFQYHNSSSTDHRGGGPPNNINEGPIFNVQSIKFTRVPVIKVTDKRTGLKGDISFAGGQHFDSMRLTKRFLKRHPQARSMLLFLKFIVGRLGIGESVQGGMTSFVLFLLISHFFQGLGGEVEEPEEEPTPEGVGLPTAAAEGLRLAMGRSPPSAITKGIEGYLGVATKVEPTYHSRPATPVDDASEGDAADINVDDTLPDPEEKPLGELLYLFFFYYRNFNFFEHGLHFTKDGRSKVVEKPALNKERRQHLHMTSPFDETFDVTARMQSTQAFEQLCRHMSNMLSLAEPQFDNLLMSLRVSPHDLPQGVMHYDPSHRYPVHHQHHHRPVHLQQHTNHVYNHQGPQGNRKYGGVGYNPTAGGFPYQPSYWQPEAAAWAPSHHHPQPRQPVHHTNSHPHLQQARGSHVDPSRRTHTPEPREGKANASAGPSEPRNQAATTQTSHSASTAHAQQPPHAQPVQPVFPFPLVPMYSHGKQFQYSHNSNINSSTCQSTAYPPLNGPSQPAHGRSDSHRNSPAMGPTKGALRGRGRGGGYGADGRAVATQGTHDSHPKWPQQPRRGSKSESDVEKQPSEKQSSERQSSEKQSSEKQPSPAPSEEPPQKPSQQTKSSEALPKPQGTAAKYVPPHARKKQEDPKEGGRETPPADGTISPLPEGDTKNSQQ